MTSWVPDPSALRRPVYLSLAEQIARVIGTGVVPPGAALPTHRAMAEELGISVQTVSRAYEELIRRGLIVGETGRGTYVRKPRPELEPPYLPERFPEIIDLSILKPVCETLHIDRMKAALAALAKDLPAPVALSFRPNMVFARHRQLGVAWLERCGLKVNPRNIHVTNGATPAMTIALMAVARPGSIILTEAIGHHTLVPLCSYLGLKLAGLPLDGEGVLPDAIDQACREPGVRALFLHPNATGPTAALMSAGRREEIVEVARQHDVQIIENDACGPLIEDAPPPLAALAPERTLYVTSFTKCVMPGLRSGYLVVPDKLISGSANRHLVTNWMATALLAEMAARWIEDGTAWDLVLWQRQALRRRQAAAAEVLTGIEYQAQRETLHVWLPLPAGVHEDQFVSHARLQGVAVAPGTSFVTDGDTHPPAIRICVGSTTEAELRIGLGTLANLFRSEPEPALLAI
jgi:DNA-binding transcriptional MocR family regulator